jgi:hypothetical protein
VISGRSTRPPTNADAALKLTWSAGLLQRGEVLEKLGGLIDFLVAGRATKDLTSYRE